MSGRRTALVAIVCAAAIGIGWLLFVGLPRWYGRPVSSPPPPPTTDARADDVRKITVRLFYVGPDGTHLTSIEHEVPYAEQPAAQARHIIDAQIAPAAAPLVSAIPPGTTLRAVFVTPDGSAYVDLGGAIASGHPGGSTSELLTVYSIVQALTVNLPAITSVQLLVDGKEVDTLAGHVDLKRPLPRNDGWVADAAEPVSPPPTPPTDAPAATPPR